MKALWLTLISSCLVYISGCANGTTYAEIGAGYKVKADYKLQPENAGGDNPTAHFRLGHIWDSGIYCEAWHWSHWFSGGPFNNRPETYNNEVICGKRWEW